jgi:hypothetical protein
MDVPPPPHLTHPLLSLPLQQNAQCVSMFPVPLPRAGFYAASILDFKACVPPVACPGVDAEAVSAEYTKLLAGSPDEARALLSRFAGLLVHQVVYFCTEHVIGTDALATPGHHPSTPVPQYPPPPRPFVTAHVITDTHEPPPPVLLHLHLPSRPRWLDCEFYTRSTTIKPQHHNTPYNPLLP